MTTRSPSSVLMRRTNWGASMRICVAQAVDSACTSSSPSTSDTGSQWPAMSAPTICGQRPKTVALVRSAPAPALTRSWTPPARRGA